ncbi:MAG: ScyD/ScyE family protein [Chloroflexota bacterium]
MNPEPRAERGNPRGSSRRWGICLSILAVLVIFGMATYAVASARSADVEEIATGLLNPRGLTMGPDGMLYVAEAGSGGNRTVRAGKDQITYRVGRTAGITRIAPDGTATRVLTGLPSVRTPDDVFGATGVAFLGNDLYVLTAAGGRNVGDPSFDNAVLKMNPDGSTQMIANLTQFNLSAPPKARQLDVRADVEGGVPYGLTAWNGKLYATDGNLETLTEISTNGEMKRLLEYPASDHVLVGIAPDGAGALLVAEYGPWPHTPGIAYVSRVTLDGDQSVAWPGLNTPIDLRVAPDGSVFLAEFSAGRRERSTARVLRRTRDGTVEVVAAGLNYLTGLALAPDGDVYVSESGHRSDDGTGRVMRIVPSSAAARALLATRDRFAWMWGGQRAQPGI